MYKDPLLEEPAYLKMHAGSGDAVFYKHENRMEAIMSFCNCLVRYDVAADKTIKHFWYPGYSVNMRSVLYGVYDGYLYGASVEIGDAGFFWCIRLSDYNTEWCETGSFGGKHVLIHKGMLVVVSTARSLLVSPNRKTWHSADLGIDRNIFDGSTRLLLSESESVLYVASTFMDTIEVYLVKDGLFH